MNTPDGTHPLNGTEYPHPADHTLLQASSENEPVEVTLFVIRRADGEKPRGLEDFSPGSDSFKRRLSRAEFAQKHGADPGLLAAVGAFARAHDLEVAASSAASRSVVLRGTVGAVNRAFGVTLQDYRDPAGRTYRSHEGPAHVPASLAGIVEGITGLHNRPIPAIHYPGALRASHSSVPPNTKPVTPQQVAQLYGFPTGSGAGQTVGIYEMATSDGPPGYSVTDLADTMKAFGGGLKTPSPINVAVDGQQNSHVSDGETGLDITVVAAVAPAAKIAVYFTGGTAQNIIHALQRMIHPNPGDPVPTILSISYGWGPDDPSAQSFSNQEYAQIGQLFQDAANLAITVLVSSGDSGASQGTPGVAQASYPATEPWVIACGGTAIGNIQGSSFTEYVWNGEGATGGGVSARFPIPSYQGAARVPVSLTTGQPGRGIPDIAGNASPNSGYPQYIQGVEQPVGGTSAVAPLYAGLFALINAQLGVSAGFINPLLYSGAGSLFRDIVAPPGPANNSYDGVQGYPAGPGWDACTGLGSVKGAALLAALQAAHR